MVSTKQTECPITPLRPPVLPLTPLTAPFALKSPLTLTLNAPPEEKILVLSVAVLSQLLLKLWGARATIDPQSVTMDFLHDFKQ